MDAALRKWRVSVGRLNEVQCCLFIHKDDITMFKWSKMAIRICSFFLIVQCKSFWHFYRCFHELNGFSGRNTNAWMCDGHKKATLGAQKPFWCKKPVSIWVLVQYFSEKKNNGALFIQCNINITCISGILSYYLLRCLSLVQRGSWLPFR